MGRDQGRLEQLEERFEELKRCIHECIAEREQLAQEARKLQAELRNGAAPEARPGIRERLKDIQRAYDAVRAREDGLASKRSLVAPKVVAARRRLREAESALATLKDPPPWAESQRREYSPHTLRELEKRARQTIRELMG